MWLVDGIVNLQLLAFNPKEAGFYGTRHLNMKGARGFKGGKAGKGN